MSAIKKTKKKNQLNFNSTEILHYLTKQVLDFNLKSTEKSETERTACEGTLLLFPKREVVLSLFSSFGTISKAQ